MKRWFWGAAIAALVSCTPTVPDVGSKVSVLASFSVLADFVQRVGQDRIVLTTLVTAGKDAHTFDPTPQDVAALSRAKAIFQIGLGFESWLERALEASRTQAKIVSVSEGIETLDLEGQRDPHIWHSVANAKAIVAKIRDALIQVDPAGELVYRENARQYVNELDELETWIRDSVSQIPVASRKLVTNHDTFGYFAHAYGFEILGTLLGSVSTEGGDPPAAKMASLVREIRASGVKAVFAENVLAARLMEVLANEAGVKNAPPLFTDALGEAGSEGDTYLRMMRFNVRTIVDSLK